MWYVIQTRTGSERKTKQLIEEILSSDVLIECIIIYYESKRRYEGQWHLEKKPMFPGYLFLVTDQPEEAFMQLKKVPRLTKLLRFGNDFVPITAEEEAFLKRISGQDQVVAMSYGIQDGDRIIVKDGVLQGLESIIRKIDRHKRRALIEVKLLGEVRQVEVGLEIIKKI